MHGSTKNRISTKGTESWTAALLLFAGLLVLPVRVQAAIGIALPSDSASAFTLDLKFRKPDSTVVFELGSLFKPPPQPVALAKAKPSMELGSFLGTPRSALACGPDSVSLDLRTFQAFQNQDQVVKTWNRDIMVLMKKTDREKSGPLRIGVELPSAVASVVGEGGAGLQVSGRQRISFAGRSQWSDATVTSAIKPSRFPSLIMQQENSFTVEGTIGSKVSVKVDQDSKRQTDLENRIQIRYKGDEDDIVQSIEAGNTTLSLPNTQFVGYSQRIQGLFGLKAAARVGPVDLTMITSQEKGNTVRNRVTAGANQTDVVIRDYNYAPYRFFDVGRVGKTGDDSLYLRPGDSIQTFELFKSVSDGTERRGRWYTDFLHPDRYADSTGEMSYVKLGIEGYVLSPDQHYIYLPTSIAQDIKYSTVAYYMRVKRGTQIIEFGDLNAIPTKLQLLKPLQLTSDSPLWISMWKNVYDLGVKNIKYEELTGLDIKKGPAGTEANDDAVNLNHQSGVPYLQLLGLDRFDVTGGGGPDGKVDNIRALLNLEDGLLIFPDRQPFAPISDAIRSVKYPDSTFRERVPEIYTKANETDLRNASKYYIKMTTRRRATSFPLGRVNIMQESEVVTLNSQRLTRGPDYTIDYDLGTITFLRQEALDPNSQLTIDYEYAPFMSLDKRSLFGMRGEYRAGADFHTGGTFLYKGSKSTDRPAQLGSEPFRDMVLDYDVYWRANTPFITKLIDALPLVETKAQSSFTASAEVARSMPNPNTKGHVLIDDFESAKRAYSFSIIRGRWTIASPPVDSITKLNRRGRGLFDAGMNWFNPMVPFPETAIYKRDIRRGTTSNATVLVMDYQPDRSPLVIKDTLPKDSAWGGIMCALPQGAWDQSRAEYIELRMAVVGKGRLHVDLGRITEDVNGDRKLNTEDGIANEYKVKDGVLQEEEDVGLDLAPDTEEDSSGASNADPNGDNWEAPVLVDPNRGVYSYDGINGTEKNAQDGDRYGLPDTEDLGGQSQGDLDYTNSYYTFELDLADPGSIKVDSSYKGSGDWTSFTDALKWETYRIPIWRHLSRIGSPDSNLIEYARLWIDGTTERTRLYIAAFNLVQNSWKVVDTTPPGSFFGVAVKNTEENRDYIPPPGVGGFVDLNGVQEKEQSLILQYRDFDADRSGRARLASATAQDFTGYRQLKAWVHGDHTIDTNTSVYLRFGSDTSNYYYYGRRISPAWRPDYVYNDKGTVSDSSWRAMAINLDGITVLKENARQRIIEDGGQFSDLDVFDSTLHVGVRGTPSLSRIAYMEIGVIRLDAHGSGEVWFDELSLSEVRRDQGIAARGALTTQFADLLGFTASMDTRNYAFRTLNEGRSGSVLNSSGQVNLSVNGSITLSKFTPESWGLSLPLSLGYQRNVATPKLLLGSDVVLDRRMQDSLQSRRENQTASTNIRFSPPSAPGFFKNTIGALSANLSIGRVRATSPNVPVDHSESYNAGATYNPQFKERGHFTPLGWTKYLLFPRSVYGTKFSVLPTSFNASGTYSRLVQTSVNSNRDTTRVDNRIFNGTAKLGMTPIPALNVSFDMTTLRNLSGPQGVNLVFSPKEFRLGTEQNFRQRFSADYKPFVFSFLTHSFTYSADFSDQVENVTVSQVRGSVNGSEDHPTGWEQRGLAKIPTHNIQLSRQFNATGTFDVAKVWSFLGYKAPKPGPARTAKKTETKKQAEERAPEQPQAPRVGNYENQEPDLRRAPQDHKKEQLAERAQKNQDEPKEPAATRGQERQTSEPRKSDDPKLYGPPTPIRDEEAKPAVAASSAGGFGPMTIWRGILSGFNFMTTPVGPLSITYGHNDAVSQNNLSDRPDLGFRFGVVTSNDHMPPVIATSASPGRVPTRSNGDRVDIKNSIKFLNLLNLSNSYGWSFSWREQSGSSTYTLSEAFPGLATSFDRLERITPIGWFFSSASVRSAYSRKFDEAGNGRSRGPNTWTTKAWTSGFSPLISVSGTIHKTIRFGFSMTNLTSRGIQNQKQPRPTKTESRSWDANFDYSFSSPKGLPIPLLRGIRLTSQMTMSVRVSGKTSQTFVGDTTAAHTLAPSPRNSEITIAPQANYSFSTRVKGGFTAQWSDNESSGQRTHIRQLALWAEFTF